MNLIRCQLIRSLLARGIGFRRILLGRMSYDSVSGAVSAVSFHSVDRPSGADGFSVVAVVHQDDVGHGWS